MTPSVLSNLSAPIATSSALLADTSWFRPGASTFADDVDNLFLAISAISAFFFVLIAVLLALFLWKYRARPGHREEHSPHHSTLLEVTWSVIPLILVVWIFFQGFVGFIDIRNPPEDAYEIEVVAQKWSWSFLYPNGVVSPELHVPENQPIKLKLSSKDVLHSLYIPAFRVKMDCVPGRYTELWFEATTNSENVPDTQFDNDLNSGNKYSDGSAIYRDAEAEIGYDLFCTEYCGTGHSSMVTKCVVHTPEGFEAWMKVANDPRSQGSPIEVGENLYKRRGCAQCHTVDGTDNPASGGPSFKGHYATDIAFTDGSQGKMDDNYIRESILNPAAKVRAGYRAIMPTFQGQLNDDEIYAIRQFIRSLNEQTVEDWAPIEGEEGDAAESEAAAESEEILTAETPEAEQADTEEPATEDPESEKPDTEEAEAIDTAADESEIEQPESDTDSEASDSDSPETEEDSQPAEETETAAAE